MFSTIGKIFGVILLVAFIAVPVFTQEAQACDGANCSAHSQGDQQGTTHSGQATSGMMNHGQMHGMVDAQGRAKGPTMGMIHSSDTLYTCPMHHEVITDNPEAKCPICNMNLTQMSQADVDSLRTSHPEGCPMDPIVVAGDSDTERCPICNMNLTEIQNPDSSGSGHMGHHGM